MTKAQATKLAKRIEGGEFGGGTATAYKSGWGEWIIEQRPAPKVDADGNRWEQPVKFVAAAPAIDA